MGALDFCSMTTFVEDEDARNTDNWSIRLDPELKRDIAVMKPVMKNVHKIDLLQTIRDKIKEVVADAKKMATDSQDQAS